MKRFLLCSFALVLLYPAGIDMYLVGLPRIAADLNASEAQLHIAFSVYLAGMATVMLFAGKIADQSGRKPVAIVGALVFMMASLLCSWASEGSLFLSGRFLQGVGAGGCYVVAFAILRDTLDEHRWAKVLSLLNGARNGTQTPYRVEPAGVRAVALYGRPAGSHPDSNRAALLPALQSAPPATVSGAPPAF